MGGPASPTTNLRRRRRISLPEQHPENELTAPVEYRVAGYSQMIKTATATGTTARIYVPASWTGKRVALVLLDPPDPLLRDYSTNCLYGLMECGDI
jgi:hypothetical protein